MYICVRIYRLQDMHGELKTLMIENGPIGAYHKHRATTVESPEQADDHHMCSKMSAWENIIKPKLVL